MEALGERQRITRSAALLISSPTTRDECITQIKTLLSYLPSNNLDEPPTFAPVEPSLDKETWCRWYPPIPTKVMMSVTS